MEYQLVAHQFLSYQAALVDCEHRRLNDEQKVAAGLPLWCSRYPDSNNAVMPVFGLPNTHMIRRRNTISGTCWLFSDVGQLSVGVR
jgi:hypothetical protein